MPTYLKLDERQIDRVGNFSGFMRLSDIIAPKGPLPISRSTWFAWRRMGKAPPPVMLSPRISAYRAQDIHALIARLSDGNV